MTKWKVLFWIMAVITALELVNFPFQSSIKMASLVGLFISLMLVIPFYGYAYQVAIGGKLLWQIVFGILLTINLISAVPMVISEGSKIASGNEIFMRTFFLLFGIFIFVVLLLPPYRYAFKSKKIWEENV